jgi:hypothetical protein
MSTPCEWRIVKYLLTNTIKTKFFYHFNNKYEDWYILC